MKIIDSKNFLLLRNTANVIYKSYVFLLSNINADFFNF